MRHVRKILILLSQYTEEDAFETSRRVHHIMYSVSRTIIKYTTKFPFCLPPSLPEASPALLQSVPPKTFAFPYFEGSFQPFIRSSYFPGRSCTPPFREAVRRPSPIPPLPAPKPYFSVHPSGLCSGSEVARRTTFTNPSRQFDALFSTSSDCLTLCTNSLLYKLAGIVMVPI